MATIKDVALKCNVSTATVSRALKNNSHISKETIEMVKKTSQELGFVPRTYHQTPKNAMFGQNMIALFLNLKTQPVTSYLLRSIGEELQKHGYELMVFDTMDDAKLEVKLLDKFRSMVQGIIISPAADVGGYNLEFLKEINKKIPVVTILSSAAILGIDSVTSRAYDAVYEATNVLIKEGHTKIGFVVSNISHQTSYSKLTSFSEALKNANIQTKNDYIAFCKFDEEASRIKTKELLTRNPEITAIMTANAGITRGALLGLDDLGLKYPDDISMIGYGNDILFAQSGIKLSHIYDHHHEMGRKAAELILSRITANTHSKNITATRIEVSPTINLLGSEKFPKNKK